MGLEYFPFYHSYGKKTEKLTDQELGRLVRALVKFSETGETQELAGRESIAFDFISVDIQNARDAYEDKCAKNKANRTSVDDRQRPSTTDDDRPQNKTKTKEKEETKKNTPHVVPPFTPPSLDEVREYCAERNSSVDPVQFYEYFQEGGWRDSKGNPVKNWKQKLITWEKYDKPQPVPIRSGVAAELEDSYRMMREWAND